MCKHDSARPALHPKQCAAKMVPSLSVITQMFTSGSFIPCPYYHMLPGDNLVLYRGKKSTHHLVVSLQACVTFKLLLGVVTSFQNKSVIKSL